MPIKEISRRLGVARNTVRAALSSDRPPKYERALRGSVTDAFEPQIRLAPPRDPEYKGVLERNNQYLETSFLPGRQFTSPTDFNDQLDKWLARANSRTVRSN